MTIHKKAPGAVTAAAEGGIPTEQGRDMSDATPTLTHAQENALIRDWAAEYSASYTAAAAQLAAEIRAASLAYPHLSETAATNLAIVRSGWQYPPVPADLWPAWATDVDVHEIGANEVSITFTGDTHADTACLERFYTVTVLDPRHLSVLGAWETEGTKVWAEQLYDNLTPENARLLAAALIAAARTARVIAADLTAAAGDFAAGGAE
jgi:hypothetical protein